MTSWVDELEARGRPATVVPLPGLVSGVTLRALPPEEWDALCAAHPGVEPGTVDVDAMRPALLAASVDLDDDSPVRDPEWWIRQAKGGDLAGEEITVLGDAAWKLNRRDLPVDVGKASGATPS